MREAGTLLVELLENQKVERVYCVPGESYLSVMNGLQETSIDTILCKHEGAAAIMAEAHGKLTGKPGIAFVTRGPGATNASGGVHVAFQDSTPMILFVGQVARDQRDREAFQEVDYRAMFAPLAKWAAEIDSVDRIPEYISHAFHVAQSGRPGPVVLALPEDMLSGQADVADVMQPAKPPEQTVALSAVQGVLDDLAAAKNPMMNVG